MKKTLIITALAAIMAVTNVQAVLYLTITGPDGEGGVPNNPFWFDMATNPGSSNIVYGLNQITPGLNLTLETLTPELIKNDQADPAAANVGVLASSYVISFITPAAPESASIAYLSGQPFFDTTKLTWLLAKDGDHGHYLWNLTGIWDGKEMIEINNLWPNQGDFSHISIGGVAVPEPATVVAGALLLLPFGASMVRIMRKKREA
jgi:hypothetical protein